MAPRTFWEAPSSPRHGWDGPLDDVDINEASGRYEPRLRSASARHSAATSQDVFILRPLFLVVAIARSRHEVMTGAVDSPARPLTAQLPADANHSPRPSAVSSKARRYVSRHG